MNIDIPDTNEKMQIASRNMLKHTMEVIESADVCANAAVLSFNRKLRSEMEELYLEWTRRLLIKE